ncbi:hypothetical protein L6452_15509 [Arctium lappa]|uniref:Uncharacterized protein n=1 Tax=Arctium lappa TaxID=4217 RepID=A0ACB9CP37_ARCLA|nr:hypothetical protein L6452_15509 [Arctium lappa]
MTVEEDELQPETTVADYEIAYHRHRLRNRIPPSPPLAATTIPSSSPLPVTITCGHHGVATIGHHHL